MSATEHVFVGGPQRAGTTLLRLVLSAHPEVLICPEALFVARLLARFAPDHPLAPDERAAALTILADDPKLRVWPAFDSEAALRELAAQDGLTPARIIDHILRAYAAQSGRAPRFVGHKKGCYANVEIAGRVHRAFPGARLVFIVRNPRDVVRSMLENLRPRTPTDAARLCNRRGQHIADLQRRHPGVVHVVRYEHLVRDPEATCHDLCRFLDLPFAPRMLAFHEANAEGRQLLPRAGGAIHPHTTTPFNPALIDQWQRRASFAPGDLAAIDRETRAYRAEFGY